jgi:Di-haem oxidoreductase, putative peroxidase
VKKIEQRLPTFLSETPTSTKWVSSFLCFSAVLGNKISILTAISCCTNIGTGDGIPVLPLPEYAPTANQMRTAPLWALRTRNRLMHDGQSLTKQDAIQRHAGQAAGVTKNYNAMSAAEKNQLLAFLDSL